jgi:hypothetical protein
MWKGMVWMGEAFCGAMLAPIHFLFRHPTLNRMILVRFREFVRLFDTVWSKD